RGGWCPAIPGLESSRCAAAVPSEPRPSRFDRRAEFVKQTIQLSGERSTEAALAALLPGIGNGERENVPTKRSRRMLPKLLGPERPQFATRQPIEAMNIGRGVAGAIIYPARSRWRPRRKRGPAPPCVDHSRPSDQLRSATLGH